MVLFPIVGSTPSQHVSVKRYERRRFPVGVGASSHGCSPLARGPRPGQFRIVAGGKPGTPLTDLQHPWRRIRARAGLDDVHIYDLRRSFTSRALALGEGLPMIGKLLGHTHQTTARYAHLAVISSRSRRPHRQQHRTRSQYGGIAARRSTHGIGRPTSRESARRFVPTTGGRSPSREAGGREPPYPYIIANTSSGLRAGDAKGSMTRT